MMYIFNVHHVHHASISKICVSLVVTSSCATDSTAKTAERVGYSEKFAASQLSCSDGVFFLRPAKLIRPFKLPLQCWHFQTLPQPAQPLLQR